MRIEHLGLQVDEPAMQADWYVTHLDFEIRRAEDEPVPVRFLADQTGRVMLELYDNPKVSTPDYAGTDPLIFHLAFVCEKVRETADRLAGAGAVIVSGPEFTPAGDEICMLRDPWGLAIQLCRRAQPMV